MIRNTLTRLQKKYSPPSFSFAWTPVVLLLFLGALFATFIVTTQPRQNDNMTFGVTFSRNYAEELGLYWKDVYDATLDDLRVKNIRLPIYWNQIEPEATKYNFSDFDYMIHRAEEEGVNLIPVVGRRQPRWPECHVPEWAQGSSESVLQIHIKASIIETVNRYKDSPAIIAWQVDNEPLLGVFGECPSPDMKLLEEEVALVKQLDPTRPVMITESGELSSWIRPAPLADWIGISMYRITWNQNFGYWYYPLSPKFYSTKAELVRPLVDQMIISELQAEPWFKEAFYSLPLEEQYHSMNPEIFMRNVDFARRTGFDQTFLWGVEWWYWLKAVKDDPAMWNTAHELFND